MISAYSPSSPRPVPSFARISSALALAILASVSARAASDTWLTTTTGNQPWETAANWTLNAVPGNTSSGATASTDVVTFDKANGRTITFTDVGRTISGITFSTVGSGSHVIGSTGYTLYLSSGGTIQLISGTNSQTVNAALRLVGANATYTFTNSGGSSLAFGGAIQGSTAGATVLTLNGTNTSGFNRLNGVVSNGSSTSLALVKDGTGAWTLANSNTFSGGVTLNAGTLNVLNASSLGTGAFTINGGTFNNSGGSALTNSRNNAQAWNGDFTFTGTSDYNIGTGAVAMNASRTVTIGASTLTVGGVISGSGFGLTKNGAGTLVLSGANTYTGATTVSAGTLSITGSLASGSVVGVSSGATLRGTGTIGGATTLGGGATVAAGVDASTLGTFTFGGTLTSASGSTFSLKLNSTVGQADQIIANGVTLNGAMLSLTDLGGAALAEGAVFTLVNNTSAGGIVGTFAGLAESSAITVGMNTYVISYVGGTGNDITLTTSAIPEPSSYAVILGGASVLVAFATRRRRG